MSDVLADDQTTKITSQKTT